VPNPTPTRLSSVIWWSVISAAFIGPGTVTTAVMAGAQFQLSLVWTVVFATLACVVLQEASARIIISSQLNLGQAITRKFHRYGGMVKILVAVPVLLGCAAYEAGNILGGVSGMSLMYMGDTQIYTWMITLLSGIILWQGGNRWIAWTMTALVGLMGCAFLFLALQKDFSRAEVWMAFTPAIPSGSEWIVLALVGTTIVPYNVFIGSAISKGQTMSHMRIGLSISVFIGGLITMWILMAGATVGTFTSFAELALSFNNSLGATGSWFLGIGLFAAGFSSAITSPYAASLIGQSVFEVQNKWVLRSIWMTVLLIGFGFGISGVKPIPVILAVQALNGLILPFLTYILIILVNDTTLIASEDQHPRWYNGVLLIIFGITTLIGLTSLDKAWVSAFSLPSGHLPAVIVTTFLLLGAVAFQLFRQPQGKR
jgi:Mn2+/Fe2+ NRAMP family transporter